jgi:chemotaxis protein MotB
MNTMMQSMYWLVFVCAGTALITGCTAPGEMTTQQNGAELDSMYAANEELNETLSVLRDSLQFLDDIESGQYYRDRRLLTDEIERLEYALETCRDGGRTIEALLVDDLFEPASATLTEDGRARLDEVADSLINRHVGDFIRIEAHSDSSPVGASLAATYPSNWELSAARAAAIVRYLVAEHDLPTRPVARNDSAAGRQKNRRIRIAVLTR